VAVRSKSDASRTRFEPDPDDIKGYTTRGRGWEARQSWFFLLFLTYFLYWVPLVYMGLRVLQFRWVVYGLFYAGPAASLALLLWLGGMPDGVVRYSWYTTSAFWVFALINTWAAREEFLMRLAEAHDERDDMRARVRQKLEETLEGDPEATVTPARRLLHWNTATETELAMLPGLGPQRAKEALGLRSQVGGFGSFRQFAERLQLSEQTQTRLRPLFVEDEFGKTAEIAPSDPAYRVLPDGRRVLELNWASAETLAALPGLGPEVGRRAVALRDGDGPFKSIEDFRFRLNLTMDAIIKITPYVSVISMSTKAAGGSSTKTGGRIVDA
jgi:DNA uptake protein ComE-like DNA-binding protein